MNDECVCEHKLAWQPMDTEQRKHTGPEHGRSGLY